MDSDLQIYMNSRRMRHIKRCNNFPCILPEDVAQHSYFVTVLSKIFAEEFNQYCENNEIQFEKVNTEEVLNKALFHDWDESFTSDIPYVVKHLNEQVHRSLKLGLQFRMNTLLENCSDTIKKIYDECRNCKNGKAGVVVSICDMLELAIYCYEECISGNKYLEPILKNCIYYLNSMEFKLGGALHEQECTKAKLSYEEVSPTIGKIYFMIRTYSFSKDCLCIDIENHEDK